jgi:alkanesulfonate monooxygenase SsuD/methylene tetrahydromethanopterin reductase-like flavin-dependent oxidoreductase (luciferase family)
MTDLGVQLSVGGAAIGAIVDAAIAFEEAGAESVWIGDHLLDYYEPRRSTPECFTTISAVLVATDRIRVGSLVASALFRHPFLLAKTAATLAELSAGRFELGIGAGGVKREHLALGFGFPSRADRAHTLIRSLRLLRALRDGGPLRLPDPDWNGEEEEVWCRPALGKTPIVVGALHRSVAASAGRYADEVNAIDYADGPEVEAVFDQATKAADRAGRTVRRSILVPAPTEHLGGGPHPGAGPARAVALGAQRLIYRVLPPYPDPAHVLSGGG